jgi:hypothetical protein
LSAVFILSLLRGEQRYAKKIPFFTAFIFPESVCSNPSFGESYLSLLSSKIE